MIQGVELRRRLVLELSAKKLGHLVGICNNDDSSENRIKLLFDEVIPALLPQTLDDMRTPFEILGMQLLEYHLSLREVLIPTLQARVV